MYVRAHEKGLDFRLEQSPDLPRHVGVDGGKLRQVLINLIGNAIKFTTAGVVVLRAMAGKKEDTGPLRTWCETTSVGWTSESVWLKGTDSEVHLTNREVISHQVLSVRFEVEDTGPGIRKEDRERMFSPFVQLGERSPAERGTGLGLAICRQYVRLMGGEIGVGGEPGEGSIFYFEIPVTLLPSEAAPAGPRRGRVTGLAEEQPRYRLLIAEDQPENRLLLRRMLEPLGFELREAVNGQEAVAAAEQWRPHLIWMDVRMPTMDGLEATRRIKAAEAGAGIKIVAVTAHALEAERRTILAAGCDDFIRKPYKDVEIAEALTKHLGARFVREEDAAPPAVAAPLNVAALSGLPDELRRDLERALIRIDIGAVNDAIEKIRVLQPALADTLAAVARDLQFGRMLRMLSAAPNDTECD
jgi:CheY-like chemotaxis protein